jgi:hypothetical protein
MARMMERSMMAEDGESRGGIHGERNHSKCPLKNEEKKRKLFIFSQSHFFKLSVH